MKNIKYVMILLTFNAFGFRIPQPVPECPGQSVFACGASQERCQPPQICCTVPATNKKETCLKRHIQMPGYTAYCTTRDKCTELKQKQKS